jgi:hypothetical protein
MPCRASALVPTFAPLAKLPHSVVGFWKMYNAIHEVFSK